MIFIVMKSCDKSVFQISVSFLSKKYLGGSRLVLPFFSMVQRLLEALTIFGLINSRNGSTKTISSVFGSLNFSIKMVLS